MQRSVLLPTLFLFACCPALPAVADNVLSSPGLRVDVFGGWAWGETTDGEYLDASSAGEFDKGSLGIAMRHDFSSRLRAVGQVEVSETPEETEADLDFIFLEWRFRDDSTLRLGRSKQPFGIYSEFFDLGTDRPFYDLPQGIYGSTEIVAESLDGLAYFARRDVGRGELRLDAYIGTVRFASAEPWEFLHDGGGNPDLEIEEEDVKRERTLGFRIEWQAHSGFIVGVSGFRGRDRHGDLSDRTTAIGFGTHFAWDTGAWLLRAELAHLEEKENLDISAGYLEVARHFGHHWQAAVRLDRSLTTVEELDLEAAGHEELGKHRDLALGLNYWVHPKLVLKLSRHWVEGGRFLGDIGEESTELWRFGVQFVY